MQTNSSPEAMADWPHSLRDELERNAFNGCVGTQLVSETERVRVWLLKVRRGERIGFHRHVLNYFWTAVTSGRARSHYANGRVAETTYQVGETQHLRFDKGEFMVHDLENIGDTDLVFTTVEFLDSANPPLPIPAEIRRQPQAA
jgi:hypothetical protein